MPPEDYNRTLDLALDSRPRIAYASDQQDLRYLECNTACETQDADWSAYNVETGEELDASDPFPSAAGCWLVMLLWRWMPMTTPTSPTMLRTVRPVDGYITHTPSALHVPETTPAPHLRQPPRFPLDEFRVYLPSVIR